MRDAFSRMNQLLEQLRAKLVAYVDRAWTTLRPHVAGWKTQILALQTREQRHVIWRTRWPILLFAASYYAAYLYGNSLPVPAPLWPPDAVLLAALLLTSPRRWWVYVLVTLPLRLVPDVAPGAPFWLLLVNWLNDTAKALLAAGLVYLFTRGRPLFASLRSCVIYVACAVLAAPLISASIGAAGRAALGAAYWPAWVTWFLGDALANLVLVPTILLWATLWAGAAGQKPLRPIPRQRAVEVLALGSALVGVTSWVFVSSSSQGMVAPQFYLIVPLLLWAVVSFGPRGIASTLSLVTLLAMTELADARGIFTLRSPTNDVLDLQLFLLTIGGPFLFLAALLQERSAAESSLREVEARSRMVVRNLPHSAVLLFDAELRHSFADGPGLQTVGLTPVGLEGRTVREAFPMDLAAALTPQYAAALSGEAVALDVEHGQHILHVQAVPVPEIAAAGVALGATAAPASAGMGMAVLQEVTEQRRARDELVRERTLTALLGALSQEFRTLAEHSPDFIARLDPDGRLLYMNQAGADLLGLPLEQYVGKTLADLDIPQDVSVQLAQALWEVVATRAPRTFDISVPYAEGQVRSLHVRYIPEVAEDGTLPSVLGIATDVSALKQAEARLAEQASELETIFESQADGVGVYDLAGRFVRANRALRDLLGLDADANYPSLPFAERARRLLLYDEQGQPLPLEQWPQWRVLRGEILAGASAMETGVRTLDGRDLWISITGAPMRAPDGQATGVVLIARDVTARRALERRVAEQAAELEAIFEAMADGVLVHDAQGRVWRVNQAYRDLMGVEADSDHFARSIDERVRRLRVLDEQGQPIPEEHSVSRRVLSGEVVSGQDARDVQMHTLDGRDLWVNSSGAPIRAPDGRISGVVLISRDVTARRQLEQQVAEQAAELEAIFAAMPDGVIVLDTQSNVQMVNHAYRRLLGVEADPEYFTRPRSERTQRLQVFDEQGHTVPLEQWVSQRLLRGEVMSGQEASEVQMRAVDGHEVWVNTSGAPIRASDSQISGVVLISRDVTARRALERKVAEQAAELEAIFEAQADVVVVYDQQGRFVRGNRAWEDFVHQSAEWRGLSTQPAFVALPVVDQVAWLSQQIQDEHGHLIAVEDRPTARALRGETVSGSAAVDELYQIADGRDVLLSVSAAPLRDHAGHITGVVVVGHDVTARRQLERQLAERERQYRTLVESSPDIIARFDRAGRYLYAGTQVEAATGVPAQELLGKTDAEVGLLSILTLSTEQHAKWAQALTHATTTGEQGELQFEFTGPSGTRAYLARFIPEQTAEDGGTVASVLTVTTDVSALKRTEQALREANARLEAARQEEARRKQIAESLRGVLTALNSKRPSQEVLQYIVRQAEELLSSAAAAIYGPDHLTDSMSPGAQAGALVTPLRVQAAEGLRIGGRRPRLQQRLAFIDSAVEQVLASAQPVALIDLRRRRPFDHDANDMADGKAAAVPRLGGTLPAPYHALLVVPIRVHDGLYGCLLLFYPELHHFVVEEVALAQTFADQVAQAIMNARLQAQLEQEAAAAERNHLARELHDTVKQELFSASLLAESLPAVWQTHRAEADLGLRQLHALTQSALAGLHALLLELRPAALEQSPLSEALRKLGAAMSTRAGVPIVVEVEGAAGLEPPLPAAVKIAFYRVAQESLMNAAKYAKAQAIRVRLRTKGKSRLELEIADDGRGFEPVAIPAGHFGLTIMRERAQSVGASMQVRSHAGQGTVVVMTWRSHRKAGAAEQAKREAVAIGDPA